MQVPGPQVLPWKTISPSCTYITSGDLWLWAGAPCPGPNSQNQNQGPGLASAASPSTAARPAMKRGSRLLTRTVRSSFGGTFEYSCSMDMGSQVSHGTSDS